MNENEDIDDTYDYFGSYLKERAEQTKNLQDILEKSAKIDLNQENIDGNIDFCGTFIDQIVELRAMKEETRQNNNFLDHTHEIQQQLMATLDEEVEMTKNNIEQELEEQQTIIEAQFQSSIREYQAQNDQNQIDIEQHEDNFLEQLQNDIQREEKYHNIAISIQNALNNMLKLQDYEIQSKQQIKQKNQQLAQLIYQQYEKEIDKITQKNLKLNKQVFKYNSQKLCKPKMYQIGEHYKMIAKYYDQLENQLSQKQKYNFHAKKIHILDLLLQNKQPAKLQDIISQLISINVTQYVVVANLSGQNLTNNVFNTLKHCQYLCELDLSNNSIKTLSIDHQFNNLQILKLNENEISQINSNILINMPILQQINLQHNQLEDSQVLTLLNLKYLKDLDISDNNISNEFFNNEQFSLSLLTINANTFILSPEKMKMYLPNLVYLSIRGSLSKQVYDNMQFMMPRVQILHFSDVTDPRPSLDEVIYAKFKLTKLKRISDIEVKNLHFQRPEDVTLFKQEYCTLNIEKLVNVRKYIHNIENIVKNPLPNKFFSAALQGSWDFKAQVQKLCKYFQIPEITVQNVNIQSNEVKQQFVILKRCLILLMRAQQLYDTPQKLFVENSAQAKVNFLLLPKVLQIQRTYKKICNYNKLQKLFKELNVKQDLFIVKQLLITKNRQTIQQTIIQKHKAIKQMEETKRKRLLILQELLIQVDSEIQRQEILQQDIDVLYNLIKYKGYYQLFKSQFFKQLKAKRVIGSALKNFIFRQNLNDKLQQAKNKLTNKKKLLANLSDQYNFDDFDADDVATMTAKALDDLDVAFDDGLKEQLSNIVQEEESKINEKKQKEIVQTYESKTENHPPKRPFRQVKPKQSLNEKYKRPTSSTSDLRASQLIYDSESHIPPVLPPINPTYDSSALITDSGLIDSELNDMSCIESMLVNSSVSTVSKKQMQKQRQPKILPEQKQVSPEKAMRVAQKDGWNFEDNSTAVAYYKMVQRQKKLAKAAKK